MRPLTLRSPHSAPTAAENTGVGCGEDTVHFSGQHFSNTLRVKLKLRDFFHNQPF